MAKFELPIYGENDEVIKTYETNIVKWGVFIEAARLQDEMKELSQVQQVEAVGNILQTVFVGLSKDELANADYKDIFNTFKQLVNTGTGINGGNSKN